MLNLIKNTMNHKQKEAIVGVHSANGNDQNGGFFRKVKKHVARLTQ